MAKSKALIAAEAKVAALEARIAVAKNVYMSQKARITELEAALNTRGGETRCARSTERRACARRFSLHRPMWSRVGKDPRGQPRNVAPSTKRCALNSSAPGASPWVLSKT